MEAGSLRGVGLLCLGGLSLFVVGFVVVVIARGWCRWLTGNILHQVSCIGGSCLVAVAGEEVG